jgi:rapamycin-insensitive companion of mTOR
LEDEELIPDLILVAQESPILSVRGYVQSVSLQNQTDPNVRTAFFVLGLISSTIPGAEVLSDHGWDATLTPLGLPTGICVPADLTKFIGVSCLH